MTMATNGTAANHQDLAEIDARGFVVLPELLSESQLSEIKQQLKPYLQQRHFGRNDFEGFHTERVYALLAKAPAVARFVEHPLVLALLDSLLLPNFLLSANLAINVHPGETAQQFHCDDAFCDLPRPRRPLGASAIWAIDEFTDRNGATEVLPGSHRWDGTPPSPDDPRVEIIAMSPGSVVVFLGTLWHRGGANCSDGTRLAITTQYCQPWVRPIETMTLAVPPDLAGTYSHTIQELLGYGVYPPFMGYVDGTHPRRLIMREASSPAPV